MEPVGWPELSERALRALGQCRNVRAVLRIVEPPAGRLRGEAQESTAEVRFVHPDFWRVDRDGDLVLLRDGLRHLIRGPSGAMQQVRREPDWVPGQEIGGLGWGHPDLFRDPPAFQTAAVEPVPTTVAGRDAWEVMLAAPGKKPYALRLAVDQETGLVLRYAAEGTPYFVEVLEIAVNQDLPADTFTWDEETEYQPDVATLKRSRRRGGPASAVEGPK